MKAEKLIRQHIRAMQPYHPVKPFEILAEELGYSPDEIVKLDANENPYGASEASRRALARMEYTHIYPDSESGLLVRAISQWLQVATENLLVGAGADELIDLIMRLLLDPGDVLMTCSPTFGMYAFDAGVQNAQLIDIPRQPDFSLDIDRLENAISARKPKLLFLASPNNPDGGLIPAETIDRLLALPVITVLDEAYIEFASEGVSRMSEVQDRENLIVLRTFSKWAGLAGLRVGYGAFPIGLVPHLKKIKQPYAVSAAAQAAALAAIQTHSELRRVGSLIQEERKRLKSKLDQLNFLEPYPSEANFILCRVINVDAARIAGDLRQKGILIRYFDKPGLRDHIRISVGKPAETDRLIEALEQMEGVNA